MDGQGNVEKAWKVRELKIAMAVCRKLFILFKRAKDVLSHEIV